jgi:hypothetical protein
MKLTFPYHVRKSTLYGDTLTIKLLLKVATPKGPIPFVFLFDTGADITSLPISAIDQLGIDINKCKKVKMSGFEGSSIEMYISTIDIQFKNKSFKVPCVFNPNNSVPILLGRTGIIDKFTITLDAKKKAAEFKEI